MEQKRIGCLVMAAGNAARFGENKLAAALDGQTLIERALHAAAAECFERVTVVTQYPEIAQLAEAHGFSCILNDRPDRGISYTIRLGTHAMSELDGILYLVSDQPLLRRDSVEKIVEAWQKQPEKIVGAVHGKRRGNPNLFPRRYFDALSSLEKEEGGSSIIRLHEEDFVGVELAERELFDCDTPQELARIKAL